MKTENHFGQRFFGLLLPMILSGTAAILLAGCSSPEPAEKFDRTQEGFSALPPLFMTTPAALFLTNSQGFSATVSIEISYSVGTKLIPGKLLGQGSHLVFSRPTSDMTYIWDVKTNGGFVLNGPLQAWAPAAGSRATTSVVETRQLGTENINGRQCRVSEAVASMSDGSTANFRIWRPAGGGLPARIQTIGGATTYKIDLTGFHAQPIDAELFSPPAEFTQYNNPQAMVYELVGRRASSIKKPAKEAAPGANPGNGPIRAGGNPY